MEIRNFEELCMNCEIIGKNDGECCRYCFITTLKNDGYKIKNKFEVTKTKILAKTVFKGNDGNIYFWYYEKGNGNIIFKNIRKEIENLGYFDHDSLYIDSEFIDNNGLHYEVCMAMNLAKKSFSSINSITISCEKDPEIDNYGWVSIDLVVDSDVDIFLEEYNNYSNQFAETIPLEKMELIHLNYSFF